MEWAEPEEFEECWQDYITKNETDFVEQKQEEEEELSVEEQEEAEGSVEEVEDLIVEEEQENNEEEEEERRRRKRRRRSRKKRRSSRWVRVCRVACCKRSRCHLWRHITRRIAVASAHPFPLNIQMAC